MTWKVFREPFLTTETLKKSSWMKKDWKTKTQQDNFSFHVKPCRERSHLRYTKRSLHHRVSCVLKNFSFLFSFSPLNSRNRSEKKNFFSTKRNFSFRCLKNMKKLLSKTCFNQSRFPPAVFPSLKSVKQLWGTSNKNLISVKKKKKNIQTHTKLW